jgi:hypothetical protein
VTRERVYITNSLKCYCVFALGRGSGRHVGGGTWAAGCGVVGSAFVTRERVYIRHEYVGRQSEEYSRDMVSQGDAADAADAARSVQR